MIEEASPSGVATLMERVNAGLAAITFDKDDAASIRDSLLAARRVFEVELWPYREIGQAIKACRELWDDVLDTLLAYRHRAGLTQQDCDWLSQWQPMPGFDGFYFRELA